MMRFFCAILCIPLCLQIAYANVEKIIFLASDMLESTAQPPTFRDLELEVLSPRSRTRRTKLQAEFPTNLSPRGVVSWVLLENLAEGQRYEFRVCWAATQPALFKLNAFNITGAFGEPELVASLATFSRSRLAQAKSIEYQNPNISKESNYNSHQSKSVILIQIFAVADYFTTNRTLMDHVPPLLVDITLDPYLFNIYPESLIGTGLYLLVVAISSWYFAKFLAKWLKVVAKTDKAKKNAVQGKGA